MDHTESSKKPLSIGIILGLIRWDKPAGTLLLMWPPLWCLFLLSDAWPPFDVVIAFIFGAFCMRSAGCVINDITDRKLDARVERTKHRPLAAGTISLTAAYIILATLLLAAFGIAIYLGWHVVLAALPAIPLVIAYPWMKRITFWPQLFLGITFNYGVLLASIALIGTIQPAIWWLYAACIFWTLGYDTIYGFQDIEDDEQIGIKSTARLFKQHAKLAVTCIYGLSLLCFMMVGMTLELLPTFIIVLVITAAHIIWQIMQLDISQPVRCKQLFKSNATLLGPFVLIGIILIR